MADASTPRKLVDNLQTDLRNLSNEAKKKHSPVKDAAETGLVKVRNIAGGRETDESLLQRMRQASNEILHPFLMGCSTKNPKLVQISLTAIQRIISHRAIDSNACTVIVNELWSLMDAECEELKLLQTVAL